MLEIYRGGLRRWLGERRASPFEPRDRRVGSDGEESEDRLLPSPSSSIYLSQAQAKSHESQSKDLDFVSTVRMNLRLGDAWDWRINEGSGCQPTPSGAASLYRTRIP